MKIVILLAALTMATTVCAEETKYLWDRNCPNELNLFRATDDGDVWVGYTINIQRDPRKQPYLLTDPDGRTSECMALSFCESEGKRGALERGRITNAISRPERTCKEFWLFY